MTLRQGFDTLLITLLAYSIAGSAHALPKLERLLDKPCRALALDQEPYWAALGDDVATVGDKKGVHEEKLPEGLRGADKELGIFFGEGELSLTPPTEAEKHSLQLFTDQPTLKEAFTKLVLRFTDKTFAQIKSSPQA